MSAIDPSRPAHRRAASSPHYPTRHPYQAQDTPKQTMATPPDNVPRPKAASRLIHSVKRTLTPSTMTTKRTTSSKSLMYSTPAESASAVPPQQQQFREADPAPSRPTIEQIAMGLHISRTPHLRPLASSPYAFSQRNSGPHSANPYEHHHHRATPITLPPPPTRSSLKKPSTTVTSSSSSPAVSPPFSSASGSSTTVTSVAPSSAQAPRPFAAIKFRMARFLPHSRSASAPALAGSPPTSPRESSSDFVQPKKAVRFTTEEAQDGD